MGMTVEQLAAQYGRPVEEVLDACRRAGVLAWGGTTPLDDAEAANVARALSPALLPPPGALTGGPPLPPPDPSTRLAPPPPFASPPPFGAPRAYGAAGPWAPTPQRRKFSGARIALIVVGGIAALAVLGVLGTAATEDGQEVQFRETVDDIADADFDDDIADALGFYALAQGDCFDDNSELPSTPTEVVDALVEEVPCSTPHHAEVYGVLLHPDPPGTAYPGDEAIVTYADAQCLLLFEPFVGTALEFSSLSFSYYFPSATNWQRLDDRQLICAVVAFDGLPLTGTMRGSNR